MRSVAIPGIPQALCHIFAVRHEPFHGPVSAPATPRFLKWKSNSAVKKSRTEVPVRPRQPSGRQRMRLVEMNKLESRRAIRPRIARAAQPRKPIRDT